MQIYIPGMYVYTLLCQRWQRGTFAMEEVPPLSQRHRVVSAKPRNRETAARSEMRCFGRRMCVVIVRRLLRRCDRGDKVVSGDYCFAKEDMALSSAGR